MQNNRKQNQVQYAPKSGQNRPQNQYQRVVVKEPQQQQQYYEQGEEQKQESLLKDNFTQQEIKKQESNSSNNSTYVQKNQIPYNSNNNNYSNYGRNNNNHNNNSNNNNNNNSNNNNNRGSNDQQYNNNNRNYAQNKNANKEEKEKYSYSLLGYNDSKNKNQVKFGDLKQGEYIVDEFGNGFISESENGQKIKGRVYLYPTKTSVNRAMHQSRVSYKIVQSEQSTSKNQKGQIFEVLSYEQKKFIGQFGFKNANKPLIDFEIQNKNTNYENESEFYFYPLDKKYPTMVLQLPNASDLYPNGALMKHYFQVSFVEWKESMEEEGPICQITDQIGPLYQDDIDCDAFVSTFHFKNQIETKRKDTQQVIKLYKKKINSNRRLYYKDSNIATIDQPGTRTYDDGISIQEIKPETLEEEIKKAKSFKQEEYSEIQSDGDDDDEDKSNEEDNYGQGEEEEEEREEKRQKGKSNRQRRQNRKNNENKNKNQNKIIYVAKKQNDQTEIQKSEAILKENQSPSLEQAESQEETTKSLEKNESQEQKNESSQSSVVVIENKKEGENKNKPLESEESQLISQDNQTIPAQPLKDEDENVIPLGKRQSKQTENENIILSQKSSVVSESKKNKKNEKKETSSKKEQQLENEDILLPGSGIFRIGIHISDVAEFIKEKSNLYQSIEKQGQSVYLRLGKWRSKEVEHLLCNELRNMFSFKKGEKKLSQSMFICMREVEGNKYEIIWDSLRIEKCAIEVKENYYFGEIENITGFVHNSEKGQDSSDSEDELEEKNFKLSIKNNKIIWSQREVIALLKFGTQLNNNREEKGQKVFQEDEDNSHKTLSGTVVEELMVLYNQEISRIIAIQKKLIKEKKSFDDSIKKRKESLEQENAQMLKTKNAFDKKIKQERDSLAKEQKKLKVIQKNISSSKNKIGSTQKTLKQHQKIVNSWQQKSDAIKQKIENIIEQLLNPPLDLEQSNSRQNENIQEDTKSQSSEEEIDELLQDAADQEQQEEEKLEDDKEEKEEEEEQKDQLRDSENSDQESDQELEQKDGKNIVAKKKKKNVYEKQIEGQKKLLLKKQNEVVQQMQLLEDEKKISKKEDQFKQMKQGFLRQVLYFKRECEEVNFLDLDYSSLENMQESFEKLKKNKNIENIIKRYLLFKKRSVARDLNEYFGVIDKEKKHQQDSQNKINNIQQKIEALEESIPKINSQIEKLQIKSEEYQKEQEKLLLEQQERKQSFDQQEEINNESEESILNEQTDQLETISIGSGDISDADSIRTRDTNKKESRWEQEKNKQLKKLEKQLQREQQLFQKSEQFIANYDKLLEKHAVTIEKYAEQKLKLEELIAHKQNEIKKLSDEKLVIQQDIENGQKELEKELELLQRQRIQQAEALFLHQEIIPESAQYITVTSPIRKFSDIVAQKILLDYYFTNKGQSLSKEYDDLIKKRGKTNSSSNLIRKLQEKIQILRKYRRQLLKQQESKQLSIKTEDILQVKNCTFSSILSLEYFIPDEWVIKKLEIKQRGGKLMQALPNFTILESELVPSSTLPYDFEIYKLKHPQYQEAKFCQQNK